MHYIKGPKKSPFAITTSKPQSHRLYCLHRNQENHRMHYARRWGEQAEAADGVTRSTLLRKSVSLWLLCAPCHYWHQLFSPIPGYTPEQPQSSVWNVFQLTLAMKSPVSICFYTTCQDSIAIQWRHKPRHLWKVQPPQQAISQGKERPSANTHLPQEAKTANSQVTHWRLRLDRGDDTHSCCGKLRCSKELMLAQDW